MALGSFPPGPLNAITDVKGVHVGHVTIQEGAVNTGLTVVMPYARDAERAMYFWGKHLVNPQGEFTGIQVLEDFGLFASPVFLTNLISVGRVYNGAISYGFTQGPELPTDAGWPPLVLGFDDRGLNDLRQRTLTETHALEAIAKAASGPVEEGNVGAGTGATAFGFKGGVGTASRQVDHPTETYQVGVLTVAHQGRRGDLIIDGLRIGEVLAEPPPLASAYPAILSVVATDAPLTPRQLNALAYRATLGWMRTGSLTDPAVSGMAIAFSTGIGVRALEAGAQHQLNVLPDAEAADLYLAATEAAEESILNALFKATTLTGHDGRTAEALPIDRVQSMLKR